VKWGGVGRAAAGCTNSTGDRCRCPAPQKDASARCARYRPASPVPITRPARRHAKRPCAWRLRFSRARARRRVDGDGHEAKHVRSFLRRMPRVAVCRHANSPRLARRLQSFSIEASHKSRGALGYSRSGRYEARECEGTSPTQRHGRAPLDLIEANPAVQQKWFAMAISRRVWSIRSPSREAGWP